MPPLYVDSNVFFYAKIMDRKYGRACADIVRSIERGAVRAVISPLVVLEVANALRKYGLDKEVGGVSIAILSLPIDLLPLDLPTLHKTIEIQGEAAMSPYDCAHAAVMKLAGISEIISADSDFDKIPWLRRIDPLKYSTSSRLSRSQEDPVREGGDESRILSPSSRA